MTKHLFTALLSIILWSMNAAPLEAVEADFAIIRPWSARQQPQKNFGIRFEPDPTTFYATEPDPIFGISWAASQEELEASGIQFERHTSVTSAQPINAKILQLNKDPFVFFGQNTGLYARCAFWEDKLGSIQASFETIDDLTAVYDGLTKTLGPSRPTGSVFIPYPPSFIVFDGLLSQWSTPDLDIYLLTPASVKTHKEFRMAPLQLVIIYKPVQQAYHQALLDFSPASWPGQVQFPPGGLYWGMTIETFQASYFLPGDALVYQNKKSGDASFLRPGLFGLDLSFLPYQPTESSTCFDFSSERLNCITYRPDFPQKSASEYYEKLIAAWQKKYGPASVLWRSYVHAPPDTRALWYGKNAITAIESYYPKIINIYPPERKHFYELDPLF